MLLNRVTRWCIALHVVKGVQPARSSIVRAANVASLHALSVRVYLRGEHTRSMGLEYTANAHVPWVHPAERITSGRSRLDAVPSPALVDIFGDDA